MPATISSTFDIVVDETILAGSTIFVANPGRAFRVVSMLCTGANGAGVTLIRTVSGGTTAQCSLVTGDLNDFPATITVGNTGFLATDNVRLTIQAATVTRVVIICEAANPQALVVT
jgi:hypothetical protein